MKHSPLFIDNMAASFKESRRARSMAGSIMAVVVSVACWVIGGWLCAQAWMGFQSGLDWLRGVMDR